MLSGVHPFDDMAMINWDKEKSKTKVGCFFHETPILEVILVLCVFKVIGKVIKGSCLDQAFEEVGKQTVTYVAYYHVQPPFETVVASNGAVKYNSYCFRNGICTPKVNKVKFTSTWIM